MSHKISLAFLIVGCFLTFTYGKLLPFDSVLPKGTGKSFKEFTYEIEKSFKELTKNKEWIYHLVPIVKSGLDNGFETITTWPVDLILRVEFLTMANGSHFVFPLSGDYEKEKHYKTVAIAVSNILMNLQTMERVDKVLRNVTKIVVSKGDYGQVHYRDHEESHGNILAALLHEYFEILHYQMKNDGVLHGVYRKKMEEAREYVERYPEMREPLDEIWSKEYTLTKYADVDEINKFFHGKEIYHRGIANKVFLKKSFNHFSMYFRPEQHKRYLLARAMILKAVDSVYGGESKINDVYQQALVKVGEVGTSGDLNTIRDELFKYILEALESDPVLYNEIKIVMKQVEKTSMYDSDMYIDFSIL